MPDTLTSAKNPVLQAIRRAASSGRPTEDGLVVVEGPHLLEEAIGSEWRIEQVFLTERAQARHSELLGNVDAPITQVSERAFAATATTETTQELLALLRPRSWDWTDLFGAAALVVALEGVQDPGNAGTIVRSAEAFGATGIVFLKGCARVPNGKLLRASAGSIFRLPFLESITATDLVEQCRLESLQLYALTIRAPLTLDETDFTSRCALVIGSEGAGVSGEVLEAAQAISIATTGVESLNAAIACSIALFHAQRQRRSP